MRCRISPRVRQALDEGTPVTVDEMPEGMQLAISEEPAAADLRWIKAEVPIGWLRPGLKITGNMLNVVWWDEPEMNVNEYREVYGIPEPVPGEVEYGGPEDIRSALVDLGVEVDKYGPEHLPSTEWGQTVGIIRWMEQQGPHGGMQGNEEAPVVAFCNGQVIDGWHRMVAARELRMSSLWAYVGLP